MILSNQKLRIMRSKYELYRKVYPTVEIEDLFTRLNTNVYETNDQELRNLIHGDMQKLANRISKKV